MALSLCSVYRFSNFPLDWLWTSPQRYGQKRKTNKQKKSLFAAGYWYLCSVCFLTVIVCDIKCNVVYIPALRSSKCQICQVCRICLSCCYLCKTKLYQDGMYRLSDPKGWQVCKFQFWLNQQLLQKAKHESCEFRVWISKMYVDDLHCTTRISPPYEAFSFFYSRILSIGWYRELQKECYFLCVSPNLKNKFYTTTTFVYSSHLILL